MMFCQLSRRLQKLLPPTNNVHIKCISSSAIKFRQVGPSVALGDSPIPVRKNFRESIIPKEWLKYLERYPEFLPDPINTSKLLVNRQLDDMLTRRSVVEIPEFYVGSIVAVTASDRYSETKKSRFVGICIHRTGQLTYANFTLRNVIDGMGIEIRYDLYNPLILSIEVLKLEKRLDHSLIYLRDAYPEFSTVPEDMKAIPFVDGSEVPVNKTLVKMKPWPWSRRWDRHLYRGIEKLENVPQFFANNTKVLEDDPVYSFDLMMEYRRHCTEEMMYNIFKRLEEHEKSIVEPRRKARSRRFLSVSKTQ